MSPENRSRVRGRTKRTCQGGIVVTHGLPGQLHILCATEIGTAADTVDKLIICIGKLGNSRRDQEPMRVTAVSSS